MNRLSKLIISCLVIIFTLFLVTPSKALPEHDYPRLANYFLAWTMTESEAKELSKWDVVVLDMEMQYRHKSLLKKMRTWNPDIVMLVYITPQEIKSDAKSSWSKMRQRLAGGISDDWYLQNTKGQKLSWWTGTYLLNVYNDNFSDYLTGFVEDELLSTGLWDGVYYDNAWDNITYFAGGDIDFDLNGQVDGSLNQKWQTGMKAIYTKTRQLAGENYLILGNNETTYYSDELNGMMLENFSAERWEHWMERYKFNNDNRVEPNLNIINANTGNSSRQDYGDMRFGVTSALLEDGYFAYDYGDTNHGQTWWYDEYDVSLGDPLGKAVSQKNYNTYKEDVWQRDFTNGLAVVNATESKKLIQLGGEYEKIHGTQDTDVNDGSIIIETMIDGYDGLILLKTFDSLEDVLFRNGDFVRFFNSTGDRVRNGFFVFEEEYKGGDKIAHIDLDGNGKRDLLVVHNNRIMAWRDDGQIYMKIYPYTAMYRGELKVAIGDLNQDGRQEIYVAPESGYAHPIKVYTRHGRKTKRDWYPYGESYTGGYSLAVARDNHSAIGRNALAVGKASGESRVSVFDYNYNLAYQWLAFGNNKIGVNLTTGDLDGDNIDEIIAGAGAGYAPVVRMFDREGNQVYDEFTAYSSFSKPGIEVLSADVDFDGLDDILTMSSSF